MINFHPNVKRAISQAAQKYGLPESFLERVAMIESKGNPNARNSKSSAGGLYQFLDSTAKQYQLNNKFDPFQATDAMARLTKNNMRYLATALGREPSQAELYLAHQQGPAGAVKIIKNPNVTASQLLGRQAVVLNGGNAEATAGDFMNHIYGLYNKTGDASKGMTQSPQGNWLNAQNEVVPLRGVERFQKAIQGDQAREPLIAYDMPLQKNTSLQAQGIDAGALKKGVMNLVDLMRRNKDAQNQQIEMAHQQMMQQPIMTGFSQSNAHPIDLTPLIDLSRRNPVRSYGQQKEQQLREELLRRTGAYNV
ncbi:transglycosylase SLT domain-containing protein [Bartonella krasnovii]|uniref:Lytic transglycosylase domain-containing protein n=1 Tax=Bartonella krasnovii TaxID=2267275 RepID=A0A5B9D1N4_9HYPH|nr:transglycosylase SLT domain-containing protein [Bartonella krasnovii]QEE12155.1 lytic transglycosylase domain-containing protein [Bartonella krasnovii]UNF37717.1 transglycosylase SLT domain-containing protein [Bartonella krasnovii]UNF39533.1 transglycosylase SLT domain-containing protein [Bartonella krasnovii]UNF42967.1 transglycosylase SLT domain-containing protein [Bartonella krasnovii]UNF51077.1 transglycosylase SLT domain-containing protein [Bartonella krasnovii]